MKGRFDGIDIHYNPEKFKLGFNAFYTGLLFKDTANISVSPKDIEDHDIDFNWTDFGNTYFAPRRLTTSAYGEFPGYPRGLGQLYAGIMSQFDLSNVIEEYHTHYLLLRHTLAIDVYDLNLAGAVELTNTTADGVKPAFAFSSEAGWQTPAAITDRLSFGFDWASGAGKYTAAYFPITREAMSFVLGPAFSGIISFRVNYHVQVLPSFSTELGSIYFLRTDATSFSNSYLRSKSYSLGLELNTGLLWVPFPELSLSLNGGIFLPGSAWMDDAPVLRRLTLGVLFSF